MIVPIIYDALIASIATYRRHGVRFAGKEFRSPIRYHGAATCFRRRRRHDGVDAPNPRHRLRLCRLYHFDDAWRVNSAATGTGVRLTLHVPSSSGVGDVMASSCASDIVPTLLTTEPSSRVLKLENLTDEHG